jgi:hypothetical protein
VRHLLGCSVSLRPASHREQARSGGANYESELDDRFGFAAAFVFVDALDGALDAGLDAVFKLGPVVDGDFAALFRFAAALVEEPAFVAEVALLAAVLRLRDRGFDPPMGSASPTALTAALAASPTVSTTFPAVLRAVPAVLPTVFPTDLTTWPGCGMSLGPPNRRPETDGCTRHLHRPCRAAPGRQRSGQSQLSLRV